MKIALATDHAGFEQMKALREYLEERGHECLYFGPEKLRPSDDYPPYIFKAAEAVASGICERGIVMGGSGQGEAMAANRIKGVRCAVFYGPAVARRPVDAEGDISRDPYEILKLERQHNDSNLLSLAARFLSLKEMEHAVELWIKTPFGGQERHRRRIEQLDGDN
jgi:ribose 5-phosphate isomerase B